MAEELSHQEMLRYNRQIMLRGFDFAGQERLKASCALIASLGGLGSAAVNPHVTLTTVDDVLDDDGLSAPLAECDIALDCTDNVAAREQLNRCCYPQRLPLISGAAIRMEGQISVFRYRPDEPCYRCLSRLFGAESLTCAEAGVMGPLVGIIGAL